MYFAAVLQLFKYRILSLIVFQAALCGLATHFISKISLIGRIGIATFYQEYQWLRSPVKTYLAFFLVQLAVIGLLYWLQRGGLGKTLLRSAVVILLLAVAGLIWTHYDFMHTYSHRLLKERFHLGFYL